MKFIKVSGSRFTNRTLYDKLNTCILIQMFVIKIFSLALLDMAALVEAATNEDAFSSEPEVEAKAVTLSSSVSQTNITSVPRLLSNETGAKQVFLFNSNKIEISAPTALPATTTATTGGYSSSFDLSTTTSGSITTDSESKFEASNVRSETFGPKEDDAVISSIEILSDRHDNNLSTPNVRQLQQTKCEVNTENCSQTEDAKSEEKDLVEHTYVEGGAKWLGEDKDNTTTSLHNSNSRLIFRLFVVGLICLVSLSLITVYTIKFCFCKKRKRQHNNIESNLSGRPSLFGHNLVMDFNEIRRNHHQLTMPSCSCFTEPPPVIITPQLNRFQSLFRPDLWARYRISDVQNSTSLYPSRSGSIDSHGADCNLPMPANLSQHLGSTDLDCLRYHDHHHRYDDEAHSQLNRAHQPLHPLNGRHCCHLTDEFSQIGTSLSEIQTNIRTTSNLNYEQPLQMFSEQAHHQPRPPAYSELFRNSRGRQKRSGCRQPEGLIIPAQSQSNSDISTSTSFATESTIPHSDSADPQEGQRNVLVKFNLSETKLLSARDLMTLSRLIDVPILVQLQNQRELRDQTQQPREFDTDEGLPGDDRNNVGTAGQDDSLANK